MKNKFHPDREAAQKAYDVANKAWQKSTQGTDEAAYLKADKERTQALIHLADMEVAHPTEKEIAKRSARRARQDRGLLD